MELRIAEQKLIIFKIKGRVYSVNPSISTGFLKIILDKEKRIYDSRDYL